MGQGPGLVTSPSFFVLAKAPPSASFFENFSLVLFSEWRFRNWLGTPGEEPRTLFPQLSVELQEKAVCFLRLLLPFQATMSAPLTAAEIEDERALVDSYGMLGKGIQEAIEIHNSRLGQMRRAVRFIRVMILRFS